MSPRPIAFLATELLSAAREAGGRGLIVVVPGEHAAELLGQLLAGLDPERTVRVLPPWDCLPYDRASPSAEAMGARMRCLRDIGRAEGGAVLVTTPEAALQRLPVLVGADAPAEVKVGQPIDPETLREDLVRLGYHPAERVEDVGQFAIRGEVIDVFPPAARPSRITVLDGVATAVRRFDPASQRSGRTAKHLLTLDPVSEIVPPPGGARPAWGTGIEHALPAYRRALGTVFTLLPRASVAIDPEAARRVEPLLRQIADAHAVRCAADARTEAGGYAALPPDALYLTAEDWDGALAGRDVSGLPDGPVEPVPVFYQEAKVGRADRAYLRERRAAGHRIVLAARGHRVIAALARQAEHATGEAPVEAGDWADVEAAPPGAVLTMRLPADAGFDDAGRAVTLVTAHDLLGSRADTVSHASALPWHGGDGEFAFEDAVIHLDHGMGVLKRLEALGADTGAGGGEVARLDFAGGTDLLAPVDDLRQIWRYGAADAVSLDALQGGGWARRRARIMAGIDEAARTLVELARARAEAPAPRLVPPAPAYETFAAGFPHPLTPDQSHAVAAVLKDLGAGHPMDRLVVGDVGFGKTEVALRAAAAAVLAGKQVAVVAPTTVLARQHLHTFRRRFEALGIAVGHLSRLVGAREARDTREKLAEGSLRIVVGTHAVAAKGVAFADLGLLVVDEEQRFGAADKAKLRRFGPAVHCLTLTATPIPRTLQTAMVGLQDVSVIATAPARRRPIRTLVSAFDAVSVRNALVMEKARGGQSFVVLPRIEDLERFAERLGELVPELSLVVAHGSMAPAAVDAAMVGFADGDGDVLLATSIIESGLDVPRANTMVVIDADRFGLAQLHQLRGRVGRGRRQGVCYLMTDPDRPVAEATRNRLSTLAVLDRLGSGMAISLRDLDARGGGDLMGDTQAGHQRLIGAGLYQHLLHGALRRARGEAAEPWAPEIHGEASGGSLPAAYIPEPVVRLNLYARLARATDAADVEHLAEEMEDRFGPPPPEARALLARARLRSLCHAHAVARVDVGPKAVALTLRPGADALDLIGHAPARDREGLSVKNNRLIFSHALNDPHERLGLVSRLLGDLH